MTTVRNSSGSRGLAYRQRPERDPLLVEHQRCGSPVVGAYPAIDTLIADPPTVHNDADRYRRQPPTRYGILAAELG